jgi:hypothetical protein
MQAQPTEQTYASDLKEWINQIVTSESLPFSKARVEMAKDGKRADILVCDTSGACSLLIEVKRPEMSASDPAAVSQAANYVALYHPRYYATHNVNLLVLWDAVTGGRIDQFAITYATDLADYFRLEPEIRESFRKFLKWFVSYFQGERPKPLDESTVEILHNYIKGIVSRTALVNVLGDAYVKDNDFRRSFDLWLADNGRAPPRGDKNVLEEYCTVLAKQYLYILVNKVMFYNLLKDKFSLPVFNLPAALLPQTFHPFVQTFFDTAVTASGDFETVFKTNFVDKLPLAVDTVQEITKLVGYLATLNYSSVWYDILGRVFEKLIPEDERHVLGQFFTRSDLVDLILGFCVRDPNSVVLDPAVGAGTFLVRSYYRFRFLDGSKTHDDLLKQLWGVDIAKFPAHLSTINLAIRDLNGKANYPNIVYSDFFDVLGPRTTVKIGVQSTLHQYGLPSEKTAVKVESLGKDDLRRELPNVEAVVGNPPYTRQEEIYDIVFGKGYKEKVLGVLKSDFPVVSLSSRASIYASFFVHGLRFLERDGLRLGFVSLRSWLDVGYGKELGRFMLDNAKIVTVIESAEERWFPDAQMLPCVTILEKCDVKAKRDENYVKFVQLKAKLGDFIPPVSDERNEVQEVYRWQSVDEFVGKIERAEQLHQFHEIEFMGKKVRIYEDDSLRIVMIKQKQLYTDEKWGKYLSAPSAFFKMLDRTKGLLVPLISVADVRRGYTTGANEFFVVPNKFFSMREEDGFQVLAERKSKRDMFWIEKDYLLPVMSKIKPYKSIRPVSPTTRLLIVGASKNRLSAGKKRVLDYLNYGESYAHTKKGKRYAGYQEHPTCASYSPWYAREERAKYSIFSPSIFWGRHIVFFPEKTVLATDCLDEIEAKKSNLNKALCAIMNTTLQALIYEFSGRYVENRDKTISNEIKIYELKQMLTVNPDKLEASVVKDLEVAFDRILGREIKLVHEEIDLADRQELDSVLLVKALGLTKMEMREIQRATGELYRRRIERFAETDVEDESADEEDENDG